MAGRQAKMFDPTSLKRLLKYANQTGFPGRDRTMVLLSAKAGMRAAEIAKLEWRMVLDPRGRVARDIAIEDAIAKKRSGRLVPMHEDIRRSLRLLLATSGRTGPVLVSARGGALQPNSVVNWFVKACAKLGLRGCSSHSGRRTFITMAARSAGKVGCSLRDIQLLAGHRSIETTQRYIDGDSLGQRRLVKLL
jgi:integrase